MGKPAKKKSYTEDVVLKKILQDIAEENFEDDGLSSQENSNKTKYEEDLIKHFKKQDALEQRQKYINIIKILTFVFIFIFLISIFTNYIDSIKDEPTQVKKTAIPTPVAKVEKVPKPVLIETVEMEPKKTTPVKKEPKKVISTSIEKPVKRFKTERELAKDMLLQQMQN